MKRRVVWSVLLGLALTAPVRAQPAAGTAGSQATAASPGSSAAMASARPRVGLALSGGGARGFAHVGILRVLEQMRVPVDCIAGTSAGAAVAGAYAIGLTPDEIEARLRGVDWNDIFADGASRENQTYRRKNDDRPFQLGLTFGLSDDGSVRGPPGLSAGHKVELFLHELLGVSRELPSFDRMAVPFRAVATDLARGDMVALASGSLVRAVRASMSVPSAFAPVREAGRLLVDGGLTRNLPVDVVRDLCADVVIAVNISSPLLKEDELSSVLGVAAQMVNILMEDNVRRSLAQLGTRDVLIVPDLAQLGSSDFSKGVDGIPDGERAARSMAPALSALAIGEADYAAWDTRRRQWGERRERIDEIRIAQTRFVNPAVLEAQITRQREGSPLDRRALHADLARLMARGDFAQIDYRLITEQGVSVLSVQPQEKAYGPNYLRFGIGAATDSKGNSYFNVPFGYSRTWVNSLGAEWNTLAQFGRTQRLGTQFFQPLSPDGRWYVSPRLLYENRPLSLFLGQLRIADYGVRVEQAELLLGVQGALLDARIGLVAGRRTNGIRVGLPLLPSERVGYAGVTAGVSVDQLDAIDFPRAGWSLDVSAFMARTVAGGEQHYNRAELIAQRVASIGPHTFSGMLKLGFSPRSELPANDSYSLGGFLNLSGYQINQLLGSAMQYGRVMYYNQIMPLPKPFGSGLYAGVSLEVGRVTQPVVREASTRWLGGASLFVGANTGIGPVYLAFGQGQAGNRALYLFLGRP
ncbi:MAG: patatin-like phospholipase family protein [Burkholderiaceae bacterium]|nr:patatin-like phospholipase family protein [Burkholderiaceae bacterium]